MGDKNDPCKKFACALQQCLQVNDFQEWKCETVLKALYDCCEQFGPQRSLVCSGIRPRKTAETPINQLRFRRGKIEIGSVPEDQSDLEPKNEEDAEAEPELKKQPRFETGTNNEVEATKNEAEKENEAD